MHACQKRASCPLQPELQPPVATHGCWAPKASTHDKRQEPTPRTCPLTSTYTHKINRGSVFKGEIEPSTNTYESLFPGCGVASCLMLPVPRLPSPLQL